MTHNTTRPHSVKKSGVTCRQVAGLVLDYVAGELNPLDALALKAHFRECPDCIAFLATYSKTIQATNSLRYETIPPAMQKRIRQFLKKTITGVPRSTADPA